ncbi:MAG: hypothetical protein KC502_09480 [Myxococcales bacterium]|nr:hypothetical protein [Myxococcales bacterium]
MQNTRMNDRNHNTLQATTAACSFADDQPLARKQVTFAGSSVGLALRLAMSLMLMNLAVGCGGDEKTGDSGKVGVDTSFTGTDLGTVDTSEPDTTSDDTGAAEDAGTEDAGATDAGSGSVDVDGPQCPGAFGCDCNESSECDSGHCIETPGGKICTVTCVENCPSEDFKCVTTGSGADTATICVSKGGNVCNPCNGNAECQTAGHGDARCVDQGDAGAFCGTGCSSDDNCAKGFSCKDVKDVAGNAIKQCVPTTGACNCSPVAITKELSTTCFKTVGESKCSGKRTCLADGKTNAPAGGGLSACLADTPEKEKCDGKDNDCDGDTDESTCDDDQDCTIDSCDPKEGCKHTNKNGPCDADGTACTANDTCKDGKCAAGKVLQCNDNNPCTKDTCDPKTGCAYENTQAPCNADDNDCTVGDACKDGKCSAGAPKACNPGKPCVTGTCSIVDGKCKYSVSDGFTCNDGDPCTKTDKCAGEICKGVPLDCNDNNPCTNDVCDAKAGCKNTTNTAKCDADGDACTPGDACSGGKCTAGQAKDCDDKEACTTDSCDSKTGACVNKKDNKSCDDGDACTTSDACGSDAKTGKWTCVGGKAKDCADSLNCTIDSCDPKTGCKNESAVGKAVACYTGPPKTRKVGVCKDGTQTCKSDGTLSPCSGQVLPLPKEVCGDSKDNTCDGVTDGNCAPTAVVGRLASASISGKVGKLTIRSTVGASAAAGTTKGQGKYSVSSGFYAWLSGLFK